MLPLRPRSVVAQVEQRSLEGSFEAIRPGDAVIAFSKRSIFNIRAAIESSSGHKCCVVRGTNLIPSLRLRVAASLYADDTRKSTAKSRAAQHMKQDQRQSHFLPSPVPPTHTLPPQIYGALPPETRRRQANLFNDPNSGYDVLVASDAVGLGLNLNIRRVVRTRFNATRASLTHVIPSHARAPRARRDLGTASRGFCRLRTNCAGVHVAFAPGRARAANDCPHSVHGAVNRDSRLLALSVTYVTPHDAPRLHFLSPCAVLPPYLFGLCVTGEADRREVGAEGQPVGHGGIRHNPHARGALSDRGRTHPSKSLCGLSHHMTRSCGCVGLPHTSAARV